MDFKDKLKEVLGIDKNEKEDVESPDAIVKFEGKKFPQRRHSDSRHESFRYLDELIHSGTKEIVLKSDIVLDSSEEEEYSDGIALDVADIVIDGDGYVIDACGKARIFVCTAKNVTIKNITLMNGHGLDYGAIKNEGELTISNAEFASNNVSGLAGAIGNTKTLKISDSTFTDNTGRAGVAVFNWGEGKLTVTNSMFRNNVASENGGAIENIGALTIDQSTFVQNEAKNGGGGAIYCAEKGNVSISDSTFTQNRANKERGGGAIYNDRYSDLIITGTTITKNRSKGKYCQGGAVYNLGEMTIEDSTIDENESDCGGAIYNTYKATVSKSSLSGNVSKGDGGAVYNVHTFNVSDSTLKANDAKGNGGAICNIRETLCAGMVSITDCKVTENRAKNGAAFYNGEGIFEIAGCNVLANSSRNHVVSNIDIMKIDNSTFEGNESKHLILNEGNQCRLTISGVKFIDNRTGAFVINHKGKSCLIEDVIFKNNSSKIILNLSDMTLTSPQVVGDGQTILNESDLLLKEAPLDFENIIHGEGRLTIPEKSLRQGRFDFTYLDKLIHESESGEIVLEDDISFERYESDRYGHGIRLDIDDMVIDGNGHTIYGQDRANVFVVSAKNVILKNINFRNGYSRKAQGNQDYLEAAAVTVIKGAKARIISCNFANNTSEGSGGTIYNKGSLLMVKSVLAKNEGRAVISSGDMTIVRSKFVNNDNGGAISNSGKMEIKSSTFEKNATRGNIVGGAIYNGSKGRLTIKKSIFKENSVQNSSGGAIFTSGEENMVVSECIFAGNRLNGSECSGGGAIRVESFSDYLKIRNCNFINNFPNSVGNFYDTYVGGTEYNVINYDKVPPKPKEIIKEFDELNITTRSIYDLGPHKVLIILDDGTNLTDWNDVDDRRDIIYLSEDLSGEERIARRYEDLKNALVIVAQNVSGNVTSAYKMFLGCESLIDVYGLETWDTSNLESVECMFGECADLVTCKNIAKLDVSNVKNMIAMFSDCDSLSIIAGLKDWDVSNVTTMWSMFADCKSLEDISALRYWNVSNVTNLCSMFTGCTSLESLNGLEYWDVSNVDDFGSLFWGCSSLSNISDLKKWNVSRASTLARMFWKCESLSDIDALSDWDVSNVTDMVYSFVGCKSLRNLTALREWDVSNVKIMRSMFDGCSSLQTLEGLEKWNPASVATVERMFDGCAALSDVSALKSWNLPVHANSGAIFNGCPGIGENPLKRHGAGKGPLNIIDHDFKFLNITGAGWCLVSLADIYSRASFITDVPYDCLSSSINAIKNDEDFHVSFNGEGWEFEVRADNEQCYFNFLGGESHAFDMMNKHDLAIIIYRNITDDFTSWQGWSNNDLNPLLSELKELIGQ